MRAWFTADPVIRANLGQSLVVRALEMLLLSSKIARTGSNLGGIVRLFVFIAVLFCFVDSFAKDVLVKGHYRRDGTYVQPHYRTSPDGTKLNNFSTKGNVNPYTGKEGTVNPYESNDSGSSYYDSNED